MLNSSNRRATLVDRSFEPVDDQGKYELALVHWLEAFVGWITGLAYACASRPLTTFVLWSLWLSLLYFALGPGSYVKVPDCGNGTLPARMVIAEQLLRGELGNWMNFSGCGTDRVLNNYRLEPQAVLLGLLPGWLGYGLISFAQRFIAGYFFFRISRDDLRLDPIPAMLTGSSYSLFSQIGIHWQWDGFTLYDGLGIPGLPLLFFLANRLYERRLWTSLIGGGLMGCGLGLSAPYFQTLFFPFLALFWYTLLQRAWTWKRFALLTCVFVGWSLITFPEMLAAARFVPESHRTDIVVRSDSPYVKYIENVEHWPNAVSKSNRLYYIIAGIGLACSRLRERRTVITAFAILAVLQFVDHYHFFNDHLLSHLGILSSFHFHRFIYLVPFLSSLVLGLGLMALPGDTQLTLVNRVTSIKLNVHQITMVVAILGVLATSISMNHRRWKMLWLGENFTSLYQHPDLLKLAERIDAEPEFRIACVTDMWRPNLGMTESYRWSPGPGVMWSYGFETTDGYQVLYSKRYKQFWSHVIQPLTQEDKTRDHQHRYWGNMLFLWHPAEDDLEEPFRSYYNLDLLSLANTKYVVSPVPLQDPNLVLLPSEHRDQLLSRGKRSSTRHFFAALEGEWNFRPLYIYENRQCLPRYFLARRIASYKDADQLLESLGRRTVASFEETVGMLERDIPADLDLAPLMDHASAVDDDLIGEVKLVSRTSDRLEFEVESTAASFLFLSNSYDARWKATVDGEATPILPANLTFQGVVIPSAGKHRVVLEYHAPYSLLSSR